MSITAAPPRRAASDHGGEAPVEASTTGASEREALRALGAFTAAVVVALALLVAATVHASLPDNALRLRAAEPLALREWLPQGWGYFSGDARQPAVHAYVADTGGRWEQVSVPHQGALPRLLGLDRAGRVPEQEVALLEQRAGREPRECRGPDATCLAGLTVATPVETPVPDPTLCGDVALVRRDPVPWAWAGSAAPTDMPATAVRLEVSC